MKVSGWGIRFGLTIESRVQPVAVERLDWAYAEVTRETLWWIEFDFLKCWEYSDLYASVQDSSPLNLCMSEPLFVGCYLLL